MSVHRYAAKRDENEGEIIEALRKAGATVVRLSITGVCDLLVGYHARNFLLEVKSGNGQLTDEQFKFFEAWNGHCAIVRTVHEALSEIGAVTDDR